MPEPTFFDKLLEAGGDYLDYRAAVQGASPPVKTEQVPPDSATPPQTVTVATAFGPYTPWILAGAGVVVVLLAIAAFRRS